jgi:hypothetical protein
MLEKSYSLGAPRRQATKCKREGRYWRFTWGCAEIMVSLQHRRECFRHRDWWDEPLADYRATIKVWVDDAEARCKALQ